MTSARDRSRWVGALAGLVPTGLVAALFVVSGSVASPSQVASSLVGTAGIATVAGWLAGPMAASEPRRLIRSALAYAIAVIGTLIALSTAQGLVEALATTGPELGAIVATVVGRAAYALVSAAYVLIPAIALGAIWALVARALRGRRQVVGSGTNGPRAVETATNRGEP